MLGQESHGTAGQGGAAGNQDLEGSEKAFPERSDV